MGVKDGYVPLEFPAGHQRTYSNESDFLTPTKENTLTWGDTGQLVIVPAEGNVSGSLQLVHVHRKRPTTFSVAVVATLLTGWAGENPVTVLVDYFIGVGQARADFQQSFLIPTPANNLQAINNVIQLPATALQVTVSMSMAPVGPPNKVAQVTILAAPVYA